VSNEINMIMPLPPLMPEPGQGRKKTQVSEGSLSFHEAIHREMADKQALKVSAHAEKRLRERNITLAQDDLDRINEAVQQAASKGARESLIIYEGLALITSIRKKTIVTALDSTMGGSQVFTNIDSAVLVGGKG